MADENANTADLAADAGSTRPMFDRLLAEMITTRETLDARLASVEKELRALNRTMTTFSRELLDMKTDLRDVDERVTDLERRPN
ncbi:MAG: hypothetical protein J2P41_00710 [Blastocatellia bacterium]|nr:hypothetical protein [Blastocatellia bacterium]